ncbi:MAG: WG repeat-containing protein [Chitinophagaceae bacterium]
MKYIITPLLLLAATIALRAQSLSPFKDASGKYGAKDASGNIVIQPRYGYLDSFYNNLAIAYKEDHFGFIDPAEKTIVPFRYDMAVHFSEGLAAVNTGGRINTDDIFEGGKWGFVNRQGDVLITPQYEMVGSFHEGLAVINRGGKTDAKTGDFYGGKWGLIDISGKEIIAAKYDAIQTSNPQVLVVGNDLKFGLADRSGRQLTSLKYDDITVDENGISRVNIGGIFDELFEVMDGGKWGFLDRTGKELIPVKYDDAGFYHEGLVKVNTGATADGGGKWGFADMTGKLVIPVQYDSVDDFSGGKTKVTLNGKSFYIDKTGKRLNQ